MFWESLKIFCKRHPIWRFSHVDGGMYGFLMRVLLSTSTQSYAVPPQELYDTLENDLTIEKEVQNPQRDWLLITRKLLCNLFAFHVILLNDLLEYCVFRQKNAREKRNVHSVSLGVFVLFWKFCQMDCEWPCGIQQRFLHFWRTSKINRF